LDTLHVLPGHAETVATASGIDINVAGVRIKGYGIGSLRPTLNLTAAAATVAVTAANCSLENFILNAKFADVAVGIIAGATDFRLKNCRFKEDTTDKNWLSCVATTAVANAADGLTIVGCSRNGVDAAELAFLSILEATNRVTVTDCFDTQASGANVGHFIIMGAFVCLDMKVLRNILNITGDNNGQTVALFATGSSTTSTGVYAYNLVGSLDTTTAIFITATLDFWQFENYVTGALGASGLIWPAADNPA
jgi:hypothetical protein